MRSSTKNPGGSYEPSGLSIKKQYDYLESCSTIFGHTFQVAISAEVGCNGYYVFTLNPDADVLVHGRMFAPAIGIQEDPVTGHANGPLGIYLVHFGICRQLEKENELSFTIRQGEAIKRDGGMLVQVKTLDYRPVQVQITGQAVVAFRTEIEV